ncbi:MAG: DNRLRE domain-containing protein, partial [Clostridia bacterium]|nr:DNRLRE domain-containing protein [Clostridia bacterium]
ALGSMTHETVKENEQYIITIHVDAEYLKDEKTKYPIRIDPTIEITYDSNGSGAIQDVTLNQNSGSSGSSGSIYVGKRNTYGVSRTLMKFPGLNLSGIASASDITSAYVKIRDMLCETTMMTVYGCLYAGENWSESTANWSNTQPGSYTEMPNAFAEVSYSIGNAKNPKHRYSLNITQAVKYWKSNATNGLYTKDNGIILKASDEVEYGGALYKTFASYNRSSNKPSLKVVYEIKKARLLGIDATGHDHRTSLESSKVHLTNCGIDPYLYTGTSSETQVNTLFGLSQTTVFASRSHAGPIKDTNGQVIGTVIFLDDVKGTDNYYSSTYSMSTVDLSNIDLIVFSGCQTSYGGANAANLTSVAVARGAKVAIGFEQNIDCTLANQWIIKFFELLSTGKTVGAACITLTAMPTFANTGLASVVICGNSNTLIK